MKKWIFFLLTGSFAMACGGSGTSENSGNQNPSTVASADGEAVYKTYCVNCHGLQGDMGGAGAYNLQVSKLSTEERMQVIRNGRGLMAGLGTLMSDAEIKAVAEYTFTLQD